MNKPYAPRSLLALAPLFPLAFAAACGGKVVFLEDGDGGNGGAGASSSDGGFGAFGGAPQTNNSVGPGPGPVTVVTVSTNDSVVVSVSTGSSLRCDTGELSSIDSFECQNCAECSQNGPCFDFVEACFSNMQCEAFISCLDECFDDPCFQECQEEFPSGAQLYSQAVNCIICDECPNNCDAQSNCG